MNKYPHLQTKRLSLRPLTLDALDHLHQLWTAPDVRRYLWDDQAISKEHTTEELHKQFDKQETVNGLELVFYSIRREAFETHASTSAV